jgi:hypothetical protein
MAQRARSHLGAPRSAEAAIARLWRADRENAEAMAAYMRILGYRRGAYRAWQFVQQHPLPVGAESPVTADWHSNLAYVHGLLRDFDTA